MNTKKQEERDSFTNFVDTGKRTKHYNLRIYNYKGKQLVDVTPLYMDMGKNYPTADYFREINGNFKSIKEL